MSDKLKTYYEQEVERLMENLPLRKYHYVQVRQSKAFMEKYYPEKINLEKMAAAFAVDDLKKEYERLKALGVQFTMAPKETGPVMIAVLDDTCGNNIQLMQTL